MRMLLAAAIAIIGFYLNSRPSDAGDLRVLAIGATAPTLHRVIPDFERTTGSKVLTWFGPPPAIREKILNGEAVDVVFTDDRGYEALSRGGMAEGGLVIARFGVGIGIRKGAVKPDVSTAVVLKAALLAATSLGGLPDNGSIGTETLIGFRKLGIADQLAPKYHAYPNGTSVVQAIAKGEIELGFSVFADMAAAKEIDYVGPFPREVQTLRPVYAAIRTGGMNTTGAKSFLELVRRMATSEFLRAHWLVPAQD